MSTAPKIVQFDDKKGQSFGQNRLSGFKSGDSRGDNRNIAAEPMSRIDWIWDARNRTPTLLASGLVVLAIAIVDWWTKPYFSLGFLYLFPIMMAAAYLPRWAIALLGVGCALLSERFSNLDPADFYIRFGFEALALCGCGLLTFEVV